jgi:hypothetical protein
MKFATKVAVLLAGLAGAGVAHAQSDVMPDGQAMDINRVRTVCTGVTSDARMNPEWRSYSLRLEFAGKRGEYLGDETVNVSGHGQNLSVHCGGPWVLMMLPAGTYHVAADVAEAGHQDITVHVPGHVVVRFPNVGNPEVPSGRIASE